MDSNTTKLNITSVELRKDPNNYCLLSPKKSFSQYDLEIRVDVDDLDITTAPVHTDDRGTYHYGERDGFARFGFEAKRDNEKPGHGGWWSSNPENIHNETGIWTVGIVLHTNRYNNLRYYMRVTEAQKLVPAGYKMVYSSPGMTYGGATWTIVEEQYARFFPIYETKQELLDKKAKLLFDIDTLEHGGYEGGSYLSEMDMLYVSLSIVEDKLVLLS